MPATTARDFWNRRDLLHDAQASPVWSSIYCTIRDRRRSRSSSSTTGRSRTPSVSSGRTTPSPSPQLPLNGKTMSEESLDAQQEVTKLKHNSPRRFMTTCLMEPQNVPIRYSSTVLIDLSSTKKRYIENVTFQTRLLPRRFSEGVITPVTRTYTTTIEIPCLHSVINTIKMDSLHQQMLQHQVEV